MLFPSVCLFQFSPRLRLLASTSLIISHIMLYHLTPRLRVSYPVSVVSHHVSVVSHPVHASHILYLCLTSCLCRLTSLSLSPYISVSLVSHPRLSRLTSSLSSHILSVVSHPVSVVSHPVHVSHILSLSSHTQFTRLTPSLSFLSGCQPDDPLAVGRAGQPGGRAHEEPGGGHLPAGPGEDCARTVRMTVGGLCGDWEDCVRTVGGLCGDWGGLWEGCGKTGRTVGGLCGDWGGRQSTQWRRRNGRTGRAAVD